MFPYSDPSGTDLLADQGALEFWRQELHENYVDQARLRGSAFAPLDAISEANPRTGTVDWLAFPKTALATDAEIDRRRDLQDEYVEWRTETEGNALARVVFTTEFFEWYAAVAAVSFDAAAEVIARAIPGADPTPADLFGAAFNPAAATPPARVARYIRHLKDNPWNNGTRGILSLSNGINSVGALFKLVGDCGIPNPAAPASEVCGLLGGACVPERNSDPFICAAVQTVARNQEGFSLADPVGIRIVRLQGLWKLEGVEIDINEPAENEGLWTVTRNGRRGALEVSDRLTIDDQRITSGTQVSRLLRAGADVVVAPEKDLPEFARRGRESSRRIG